MISTDPDITYFITNLRGKSQGNLYVRRWRELNETKRLINKLSLANTAPKKLAQCRTEYIRLNNLCSQSLIDLESAYQWPPP